MTHEKKTFMTFPCDFPLKIIGKNTPTFQLEIEQIIRKHFSVLEEVSLTHQTSAQGHYFSLTATIRVYNQETLDALYIELTQHPDIKMVL